MKISIIVPVFNEEEKIAYVVNEIHDSLSGEDAEIIVVDDGSTDNTADILAKTKGIKSLKKEMQTGYGSALKTGIREASSNTIVITDGDGTYPNKDISKLVQIFNQEGADMVVGARTGRNVQIPLIRKPAKWCIGKLANYLTGVKIPDINSGLRVIRKDLLEKFIPILPDGFSFTTTITLALLTNGYKVKYVPIDYHKRSGKSKIKPVSDTLNFIQLIIRTILYFNPLKIFLPLSFSLFVMAFAVLLASWYLFGKAMDVTFGVILMASILVMAIGMLADLIDKRMR